MTDSTDNARPLGPWQAFPAAPSSASQTQEGGRMDNVKRFYPSEPGGAMMSDDGWLVRHDDYAALLARLEAVEASQTMIKAERDGLASLLLSVQQDSIAATQALAAAYRTLKLYSCEDGCNECPTQERDRVSCGWTALNAIRAMPAEILAQIEERGK